jgi:hypothetical protein
MDAGRADPNDEWRAAGRASGKERIIRRAGVILASEPSADWKDQVANDDVIDTI